MSDVLIVLSAVLMIGAITIALWSLYKLFKITKEDRDDE